MSDLRHYAVEEKLKNGLPATVRAIRPDDKSRLVAAFEELEPQSIYSRFFQHKRELTPQGHRVGFQERSRPGGDDPAR